MSGLCIIDEQESAKFNYLNGACVPIQLLLVCMYVCMFLCVCELLPSAELGSVIQPCSRSRFLGLTASKDQSQQSSRAQRERASDRQGSASMPSLTPVMRPETRGAHAHSSISLSVFATVLQKLLFCFVFLKKDNFKLLFKGSLFLPS